jgi:methionine synthase II (cobalamin-independent)
MPLKLAARSADAISEAPYTRIFHQGAAFYAKTTLDTTDPRFRQLRERIKAELSDEDSLKQETLDAISAGLEQYVAAVDEVISARNSSALARTHCDSVRAQLEEEITRVYAALLLQIEKKAANRIFPKAKRRSQENKNTPQVSIGTPLLSP